MIFGMASIFFLVGYNFNLSRLDAWYCKNVWGFGVLFSFPVFEFVFACLFSTVAVGFDGMLFILVVRVLDRCIT